ncbi:hypothetical protein CVM52_18475 [Pseudooceanicola lipolyticus]|uniref:Uncharacterized protein n=1 Tax=Pseudooceanicola lipolyticus TaxID=2029104 RepID=A0A2M8IX99_9RHOB|nr:hypothetical protein [Pseudooceanicola lipolyticus]PJE35175.1 hypothetical protein CVM52_18475 [Pseudooceanicola lipolyticus]
MSDPVSNLEIEDVLSSIRRLVTEEARSAPRRQDKEAAPKAGNDRLVLTPSQRVSDDSDTPAAPDAPATTDAPDATAEASAAPEPGKGGKEVKPFALTARYSSVEYADEIEFRRSARRVLRRPPRAAAAPAGDAAGQKPVAETPAAPAGRAAANGSEAPANKGGETPLESGSKSEPWRNPEATLHDAAATSGLTEQGSADEDGAAETAAPQSERVADTAGDQAAAQPIPEATEPETGADDTAAGPEAGVTPDAGDQDNEEQESERTAMSSEAEDLPDDGVKQEERAAVEFRETGRFEQAVRAEARRSQGLSASDTLSAKIQALEAAIARKQEQWEPDGDVGDDYAGLPVNTIPWKDRVAEVRKAAAEARDTGAGPRDEPVLQLGKSASADTPRGEDSGKLVISEDEARQAVAESIAQVAELAKAHAEAALASELEDMASEDEDQTGDAEEVQASDAAEGAEAAELPGAESAAEVGEPEATEAEASAEVVTEDTVAEVEEPTAEASEPLVLGPEFAEVEDDTPESPDVDDAAEAPAVETPEVAATDAAEPAQAAEEAAEPEPVVTAAAAAEAEDAPVDLTADETVLDEDSLRELVADIVRQELQGALGERITRNVRKLVRREIHRALTAQNLE